MNLTDMVAIMGNWHDKNIHKFHVLFDHFYIFSLNTHYDNFHNSYECFIANRLHEGEVLDI